MFHIGVVAKPTQPVLYTIKVDANELSGVEVQILVRGSSGTVRLAMAAHPEYDDRYFRYVENFTAESGGRKLPVTKPEDSIWQVEGVKGDLTVTYRVAFVAKEREWRQAWKPHLTANGGMVGDLHMLMYVIGDEKRSARLTLDMPAGWKAVSGLAPTDDPRTFGGTVELLLDSPVLVGDVKEWKFTAGGVPHTVAIWSPDDAKSVDAAPIVDGIQKLAEQAIKAFGKPPYPRYAFLLENGGQAALEHATSVNIGISRELSDTLATIGHEYVHVWNLMDVRPRERVGLRYHFAEPTGVLWWNEGATIMFSDLLLRRAGGLGDRRSRMQRLETLIARYLSAPGYSTLSAETVSRGDSHPEFLGDNFASTHLQGEVLVTMLDLKIRDATDSRRNATDVMRALAAKFDASRGIVNDDIENALADVCGCDLQEFFRDHISGAKPIDFNRYLALIGVRSDVTWSTSLAADGKPSVDMRIGPASAEGEMKLRITNPTSAWAKAGVKTGDRVISADGKPTATWQDFRAWLRTLKVGDVAKLIVERGGVTKNIDVTLVPFDTPTVRLTELSDANAKQVRIRDAWESAN